MLIPRRLTHFRCAVFLPVLIGTVACSSGDRESTDANGAEVLAVSGENEAWTNTVLAGGTVPNAYTQQSTELNSVLVVPTTVSTFESTEISVFSGPDSHATTSDSIELGAAVQIADIPMPQPTPWSDVITEFDRTRTSCSVQ